MRNFEANPSFLPEAGSMAGWAGGDVEIDVQAGAPDGGYAWLVSLPHLEMWGASLDAPLSGSVLLENGVVIGPGNQSHDDIRNAGGGRFSHWGGQLWFSSSDGTDPRTNGRTYVIRLSAGKASGDGANTAQSITLSGPYVFDRGFAWRVDLKGPVGGLPIDRASIRLLENDKSDGFILAPPEEVRRLGRGRAWLDEDCTLWFSTSDSTNPNMNRRRYVLEFELAAPVIALPEPEQSKPERPPAPILAMDVPYKLSPAFQADGGKAWVMDVPQFEPWSAAPGRNGVFARLTENGRPLGPGDSLHDDIRSQGGGAFSLWQGRLWISTSDGTDPNDNGRSYVLTFPDLEKERIPYDKLSFENGIYVVDLPRPFSSESGFAWQAQVPALAHLASGEGRKSELFLIEDGRFMNGAEALHSAIREQGGGRFSHWGSSFWLSSSDNTDPNRNGRRYQIGYRIHKQMSDGGLIYQPAGRPFMYVKDGQRFELPRYCNIGLTNKCNLRCEICGSQKSLDNEKISRRFMDIDAFRKVAETIMPFMTEVELSSYGEPSLHPDFEEVLATIRDHDCVLKLQTNATLLTDRVINLLSGMVGTVWMSIDAVGPLFDKVRLRGRWEQVDRGVRELARRRDPSRLKLCVNPTVTRRTMPVMIEVLEWAYEVGVEAVNFRKYDPIIGSFEEQPSADELKPWIEALHEWAERHPDGPDIRFEPNWVRRQSTVNRETVDANLYKIPHAAHPNYPIPSHKHGAHAVYSCMAPLQYVEIGLDGEVYACCRTQRTVLGFATDTDEFLNTWLGARYQRLRQSLRHDELKPFVLPECAGCVKSYYEG